MTDKSTKESSVERYLVTRAAARGGQAIKLRPPTGRGFPDRTLVLPGGWVAFVELKRPHGGRVAKHQAKWAGDLLGLGQRVYLASTYEDVDVIFTDYWRDVTR